MAAPTATSCGCLALPAHSTEAASPFAADSSEALPLRPPPKCRAQGTASPATWWSARAGSLPGPPPGPPGPGVFRILFLPPWHSDGWDGSGSKGLWSAQWLCPCADPRAILCRTVLGTAWAHYPRGTSRVWMKSFCRPVLSSSIHPLFVMQPCQLAEARSHTSATLLAEK